MGGRGDIMKEAMPIGGCKVRGGHLKNLAALSGGSPSPVVEQRMTKLQGGI
jgi:hypothetical protein